MDVLNSTIVSNAAGGGGAGGRSADPGGTGGPGGYGGGIANVQGTVRIVGGTLNSNNVGSGGLGGRNFLTGERFNGPSGRGADFFNDTASVAEFGNSIIAVPFCRATIEDSGHNLIAGSLKDGTCGLLDGTNGNIVGVFPYLAPLGRNGGSTQTVALCEGEGVPEPSCAIRSAAIDAGDDSSCLDEEIGGVDQRGYLRNSPCDIGAFEVGGVEPTRTSTANRTPSTTPSITVTSTRARTPSQTPTDTAIITPTSTASALATGVPIPTSTPGPAATSTPRPVATSSPSPSPTLGPCVGDCNGDGGVTVDELVRGVNIALGALPADNCPSFDSNGDGRVSIDELIRGVNAALGGCV